MGVGDFIEIASFSAFFGIISRIGTLVLTASQIVLQYMSLTFTVGMAIGMTTSSLVAQNLEAKQPERAMRSAIGRGFWTW